jgi:formyl-CoA transferase
MAPHGEQADSGADVGIASGPLAGTRVLELGNFIAGPFAGQLLADYGADVIKIETPVGGDPMRRWGVTIDGDSLWWPAISRQKRSVTIDLRASEGQALVRRLAAHCDLVVENFRPGTLASWRLGYEELAAVNPALVLVHVSGFGQTGPRANDPGFGSIGEAVGGVRHTTGSPDRPPSRSGISLGDALAAMFAVIGGLAALTNARATGRGQEVDVAIYEAVAAVMESTMVDFELGGVLRGRSGSVLPGVAPSNAYLAADGGEIVIAANADSIFGRLCEAMGNPELAFDDRFATHEARGRNMDELDECIGAWAAALTTDEVIAALDGHEVPNGRIFTASDMLADAHYAARDMVLRLESYQGWNVPAPGIVPKFSATPGVIRSAGPPLGKHTAEVLGQLAGLDEAELATLHATGVV